MGSELAEGRGQYISEGPGARAGNQQAEGKKEFGEGIFVAALTDVEAVREVDEKDGAEHDDDDADGADAKERAGENAEASGELSQADEIADGRGRVHADSKFQRAWAAENAKENTAAVIEKWERAGQAKNEQDKVELR